MYRRITIRLVALTALLIGNAMLWSPGEASSAGYIKQCERFENPEVHCHCVAPVTVTNCSEDDDCDDHWLCSE
jgi:hypothetical protein